MRVPGAAHAFRCDVSRCEDVEVLARFAESLFERPVTLVASNAGVGIGPPWRAERGPGS